MGIHTNICSYFLFHFRHPLSVIHVLFKPCVFSQIFMMLIDKTQFAVVKLLPNFGTMAVQYPKLYFFLSPRSFFCIDMVCQEMMGFKLISACLPNSTTMMTFSRAINISKVMGSYIKWDFLERSKICLLYFYVKAIT